LAAVRAGRLLPREAGPELFEPEGKVMDGGSDKFERRRGAASAGRSRSRHFRVAATLDTVGLLCPAPLMKTAEKLGSMASGEVLEVICDDPGVEVDLPAWCAGTGNELLLIEKRGRQIRALIRKK